MSDLPPSIEWTGDAVRIIDQRRIPAALELRSLTTVDEVIDAISTLAVRGANVIGSAGALGLALGVRAGLDPRETADRLIAARPTAVNLRVAVERALAASDPLVEALRLIEADRDETHRIGEFGRAELRDARRILTHCNTGKLATTGWGTGLGIIYAKHEAGEPVTVIATETRPLRQGARLTAWELSRSGVDVELIVDAAAAAALATGTIDAVIVGADRIAANGDTANKIGTRALAIAAFHEGVPFYVAATLNAIDAGTPDGSAIEIELRSGDEVREGVADDIRVWNPAFDVTPAKFITGIITEAGILRPPFAPAITEALTA
ncbi:S-methyl-5-thioribose-1-phosphate isomerase [Pseudolysinimonas sp.]|jgi:methylthioribose-1-phosphate isomerase|uniref:S-methyl-5-thioribose-1-phosphate isomerase n=1 Tax=Pseudolysinimonas sp. TaxID=2680009 RepID=UPI0037840656